MLNCMYMSTVHSLTPCKLRRSSVMRVQGMVDSLPVNSPTRLALWIFSLVVQSLNFPFSRHH